MLKPSVVATERRVSLQTRTDKRPIARRLDHSLALSERAGDKMEAGYVPQNVR
jgi:hypothetical protein